MGKYTGYFRFYLPDVGFVDDMNFLDQLGESFPGRVKITTLGTIPTYWSEKLLCIIDVMVTGDTLQEVESNFVHRIVSDWNESPRSEESAWRFDEHSETLEDIKYHLGGWATLRVDGSEKFSQPKVVMNCPNLLFELDAAPDTDEDVLRVIEEYKGYMGAGTPSSQFNFPTLKHTFPAYNGTPIVHFKYHGKGVTFAANVGCGVNGTEATLGALPLLPKTPKVYRVR